MRFFIIPALAALALGGCVTVDNIQRALPVTCALINVAYDEFLRVNAEHPVNPKIAEGVRVAVAGIVPICNDPSGVTVENALVKATEVLAAVTKALREAKKVEDAATP